MTAKQEVARLESYKKTAPQSRAEIVRLGKMLPESEGIPSLIIELTQTSDASGVALNSITRGATVAGTPFGLQSVTLAVTGRFFDVEDFLYRLESYVAFRNASFRVTGRLLAGQDADHDRRHRHDFEHVAAADGHRRAERVSVGGPAADSRRTAAGGAP